VLTGAHGDLRPGLPWQALFARDPGARPDRRSAPQHVPSRHLVVLDADPALVVRAVRSNPALVTLLNHGWMHLVVLDRGRTLDVAELLADEEAGWADGRVS